MYSTLLINYSISNVDYFRTGERPVSKDMRMCSAASKMQIVATHVACSALPCHPRRGPYLIIGTIGKLLEP